MFKRKKFSFFTWVILIYMLASGVIFLLFSLQLKFAQDDANNYRNSENCMDPNFCREIVFAKVEVSQTIESSRTIWIHKGYTKSSTKIFFYVRLLLQNLEIHEVIILPNLEIEDNYNVPNIFFPVIYSQHDNFVERIIPENAILNVELWNGEPTIIFTKYINVDFVVIDSSPIFPPIKSIQNEDESENSIEYAITTTNNPLVKQYLLQDKFNQTITLITIFGLFIVGLKIFVKVK